jgi:hypothetical protein
MHVTDTFSDVSTAIWHSLGRRSLQQHTGIEGSEGTGEAEWAASTAKAATVLTRQTSRACAVELLAPTQHRSLTLGHSAEGRGGKAPHPPRLRHWRVHPLVTVPEPSHLRQNSRSSSLLAAHHMTSTVPSTCSCLSSAASDDDDRMISGGGPPRSSLAFGKQMVTLNSLREAPCTLAEACRRRHSSLRDTYTSVARNRSAWKYCSMRGSAAVRSVATCGAITSHADATVRRGK